MTETLAVELIQSIGFPAVVTLWFMFRLEKILNDNTAAVKGLSTCISGLKK